MVCWGYGLAARTAALTAALTRLSARATAFVAVVSSPMPEAPTVEVLPADARVLSTTALASPSAMVVDLATVTLTTPLVGVVDVVVANCRLNAQPQSVTAPARASMIFI